MAVDDDFVGRLFGKSLTTIEVFYYQPLSGRSEKLIADMRAMSRRTGLISTTMPAEDDETARMINLLVWQTLDMAPHFDRTRRYLDHWEKEIEAKIHSVRIFYDGRPLAPSTVRHFSAQFNFMPDNNSCH